MHKILKLTLTSAVALVLVACGDRVPDKGTPEYDEYVQSKSIDSSIKATPSWFLDIPVSDKEIYGVGTGISPNMQIAIDKAVLEGKISLADQTNGKVSSRLKQFSKEVGADEDKTIISTIEKVSLNAITAADLAGYFRDKIVVQEEKGQFRVFVLLKLPFQRVNKLALEAVKKEAILTTTLAESDAFQQLEAELDKLDN